MTPDDLKAWRSEMRLSQRAAAIELGISFVTFQQYERGIRYSTGAAVRIPTKIRELCSVLLEERGKLTRDQDRLSVRGVPPETKKYLEQHLKVIDNFGMGDFPTIVCFIKEKFDPMSDKIDVWLREYDPVRPHAKFVFPEGDNIAVPVVVLYFFDHDMAMSFAMRFMRS